MKKLFTLLLAFMMLPSSAHAIFAISQVNIKIDQDRVVPLAPFEITTEADGEVTAEHGINLIIENAEVLWEVVESLTMFGSAAENGRVANPTMVTYSNGYKVLHIPVLQDFESGEMLSINGHSLRTYDQRVGNRSIGVDLNGDLVADTYDLGFFEVKGTEQSDQVIPYPPTELAAAIASDLGSVQLSWVNTPDYDFAGVNLERTRVRAGQTENIIIFEKRVFTDYLDTDVQAGDTLTYRLYSRDQRNTGDPTSITVTVEAAQEPIEEPEEPEAEQEEPASDLDAEERELLEKRLNYYKVRQAIKCRRDDSACLWAKINLVYSQERLGQSDVNVSLSERDLYLMGIRIRFTESRYQTRCIEAEEPAKTCAALGRSLARARYFLDQNGQ